MHNPRPDFCAPFQALIAGEALAAQSRRVAIFGCVAGADPGLAGVTVDINLTQNSAHNVGATRAHGQMAARAFRGINPPTRGMRWQGQKTPKPQICLVSSHAGKAIDVARRR